MGANVKRLALAGLLFLGVAFALWALFRKGETSEIRLTGIVSANEAFVASEVSGRLKELRVSEGDPVSKGQVVAVLATEEIDALRQQKFALIAELTARLAQGRERVHLERERVKSQIDSAAAQLSAAKNKQEEVETELEQARSDVERMNELFAQGLVPHQRVERQQTVADVVQAKRETAIDLVEAAEAELAMHRASERQVRVMEQEVQQTDAQLDQARADLEQIKVRRGYTELKSPLTGMVSLAVAREGEFVPAGSPVVTIVDLNDVWVRAEVEETFVSRLVIGQPLSVILASEERLSGNVTFISPEAEFATQRDVNRVKRDIRTFGIKVALQNPTGRVHPGMTAFVLLPSDDGEELPRETGKETSLAPTPQETFEPRSAVLPGGAAMAAPPPTVAPPKPAEASEKKKAPPARSPTPPTSTSAPPEPKALEDEAELPEISPPSRQPSLAPPSETLPEEPEELEALEEILADIELEAPIDAELKRTLVDELRGAPLRPETRREEKPPAPAAGGSEPQFRLEGISVSEGKRIAIINGVRVLEGDSIGGARVARIAEGSVQLELNGRTITLRF